jgi:ABC-type polysaccharide/polyol phosphate export permease
VAAVLGVAREHRRLLAELFRRDVRARFAGARFGLLWSLITPAVQLAAYGLIFGYIYAGGDRPPGAMTASLFCGLWPWWAFQEAVMRGTAALVDQSSLMRRLPMPAMLPLVAATSASIVIQMLGFALFLVVFALLGVIEPRATWLLLPLLVAVQLALTIGIALVLAPFYLVARDVLHAVTLALTVGFFVSPVLYELASLPESLRVIVQLNPLVALLGLFRSVVLGAEAPPLLALLALVAWLSATWRWGLTLVARIEGRIDEYC